jgi:hypothetical protein
MAAPRTSRRQDRLSEPQIHDGAAYGQQGFVSAVPELSRISCGMGHASERAEVEVIMKTTMFLVGAAALGAFTIGCGGDASRGENGSASGELVVQGTVGRAVTANTPGDVRVVAIGSDGNNVWTTLDKDGDFTVKLHVGTSYRIVVATPRTTGTDQQVVGQLVLPTADGRTPWLAAKAAGVVDLGTLRVAATPTTAGALKVQCACSGSGSGGGGDDNDQGENDDDQGENNNAQGASSGGAGGGSSGQTDSSAGGGHANHADDNECHEGHRHGDGNDDDQGENDDDQGGSLCGSGGSAPLEPSSAPDGSTCGGDAKGDDANAADRHTCR